MDNYFDYLKFRYRNGSISSIEVGFGDNEDKVIIPKEYISALQKFIDISEDDKEMFFIIAKAIMLKKENRKVVSSSVKQYDFGNNSTFPDMLISKLLEVCRIVSIELLVAFFNEAKVEDLDIFLNKTSAHEFSFQLLGGEFYADDEED